MSATDELRRLLDERGVKWRNPVQMEGTEFTRWHDANGTQWTASEVTHADSKLRIGASHVTPAQAVEATLGPETCRFEFDQKASDRCQGPVYSCDKCGALSYTGETDKGKFKFCPNCGRAVRQ